MDKTIMKIMGYKKIPDEKLSAFNEDIQPIRTLMTYYECALMEVETKFKVLNNQFSLRYDNNPIESIKTRMKSFDSMVKKLNKKDLPYSIESIENHIHDVAGVRVICSFEEDVYLVANCFMQQDDVTVLEVKDYIKNPKPSGYRSLHIIVEVPIFLENEKKYMKVEVQLRTLAMDLWASQEHKLRYKKDINEKDQQYLQDELMRVAEVLSEIDHSMQQVNTRIHSNQYEKEVDESIVSIQDIIKALKNK